MTPKLSVLEQSFSRSVDSAQEALQESIAMAQHCESLGYDRLWVSEHHAFPTLAGSAPEILLAALGAATRKIRLGSGGIMLPHYSPYKVAEVFSVLSNLYPNRIELGMGRAPGADMATAMALATDNKPKFERFPQLVDEVTHYLKDKLTQPIVSPKPHKDIPLWILGTSSDSAKLAAEKGLNYNLALFINPHASENLISWYKQQFKASDSKASPYATVAIEVFCCDTDEQAELEQLTFDINFFRFVTGQQQGEDSRLIPPEEARDYPISNQFQGFLAQRASQNRAIGTQEQVQEQIQSIAKRYSADEVMLVSNMYYFKDRKRSFELVKAGF